MGLMIKTNPSASARMDSSGNMTFKFDYEYAAYEYNYICKCNYSYIWTNSLQDLQHHAKSLLGKMSLPSILNIRSNLHLLFTMKFPENLVYRHYKFTRQVTVFKVTVQSEGLYLRRRRGVG